MGIPALTARLRPFSSPIQWPPQTPPNNLPTHNLIIDGPSLAYHIHYRCLCTHTSARTALDAYPSYSELASALLTWLSRIEASGLSIHSIFFDGYLPERKTAVRRERLAKYLAQLRAFRAAHADLSGGGEERAVGSSALFSLRQPSARLSALPAVPFLVPVVIETLLASRYADVVAVVPGEADAFCAEEGLKGSSSVVVTSDSDLLVQCAGGRVVFFQDLEWDDQGPLKGLCYRPEKIAATLGCSRFRDIACVMARETYFSPHEAAKMVKTGKGLKREAVDDWFNREIQSVPAATAGRLSAFYAAHETLLSSLDPRISELACDWALKKDMAGALPENKTAVRMYLPFLIDDPGRASAWRISLDVRRLAYSVLLLSTPGLTMWEIDRRGERFTEGAVALYGREELRMACESLIKKLGDSFGLECENAPVAAWRGYGVISTLEMLRDSGSALPELPSGTKVQHSWPVVHFKAQVDGLLYSLRILYMLLRLVQTVRLGKTLRDGSSERQEGADLVVAEDLQTLLSTMPPLGDLMTSPSEGLLMDNAGTRFHGALSAVYSIERRDEEEWHEVAGARRKRAKKERREQRRDAPKAVPRGGNIYSLLEEA